LDIMPGLQSKHRENNYMWFKNLQLYRLTDNFDLDAATLHEKLAEKPTRPCEGLDLFTVGWDKPLGREGLELTHQNSGCVMVCMRREERILPAAVIREVLEDRVVEIEQTESRKVGRKEKLQLKDEIYVDLLPKAFTKSTRLYAYIDTTTSQVIVDTPSATKAEELLSLMRETLGSFPVKPFEVNQSVSMVLTNWLTAEVPQDFELEDDCELRDTGEDGGIVRLRRQALAGDEIRVHLEAGKVVVKLAANWQDRISCILSDDVSVKRLKFLEVVQEAASDADCETAAEQFDADFALMALELRKLIARLVELYGGMPAE